MRIDDTSADHIRIVAENMRPIDVQEFLAVSHRESHADLVEHVVRTYAPYGGTLCISDDRGPVAVGALVEARPNVITLMFFANERFPEIACGLARFTTKTLFPQCRRNGVHRIECVSIDGYEETHRWLGVLGLKHEATLRGFGKGGEAFHQFAWVADDVR